LNGSNRKHFLAKIIEVIVVDNASTDDTCMVLEAKSRNTSFKISLPTETRRCRDAQCRIAPGYGRHRSLYRQTT